VPRKFWFQDSLDAITNILSNEQDYLQAKLDKRIRLQSHSESAALVKRKSRQWRRLLSQALAFKNNLNGISRPVELSVPTLKTCWLVCGPESSGSVLIAKTISHAVGASKQFSDYSGYGYNGEIGIDNLVLHRSVPFLRPKKSHHDFIEEINLLKTQYNCINYILTTRDPLISIISKTNRFGGDISEGQCDLDQARDFFVSICNEPTCFIWSYETMQLLGSDYFLKLYRFFDIDSAFVPSLRNANAKYILPSHDMSVDGSLLAVAPPILYCVNLFLKNGELPGYVQQTIDSLLNALNHAPMQDVRVMVMVDASDFKFFKQLFKGYSAVIHVCKLGKDSQGARLPKLRDIFLYDMAVQILGIEKAEDAYYIYANADICIPTYFFSYINQQLLHAKTCRYPDNTARGTGPAGEFIPADSFVINRRDLIAQSSDQASQLAWHPGSDLFVFPLRFLPSMYFGDVTIGLPPVAPIIWLNLLLRSQRTLHISDLFITWHHGNDQQWRSEEVQALIHQNTQAAALAFWRLIEGDKSVISSLRLDDSINSRNLRNKADLFVSIAEGLMEN
jgi:hypothetical protein